MKFHIMKLKGSSWMWITTADTIEQVKRRIRTMVRKGDCADDIVVIRGDKIVIKEANNSEETIWIDRHCCEKKNCTCGGD